MIDVLKRLAELDENNPQVYKDTPTLNKEDVLEDISDRTSDRVANALSAKGVTYSSEKEKEIISMIGDELSNMGMDDKKIRYLISYDEDFVSDVLGNLPREESESIGDPEGHGQRRYDREQLAKDVDILDKLERKALDKAKTTFPPPKKDAKESEEQVAECGMMPPMGGAHDHHTPASINISADNGDELSRMLKDIMTLAGRSESDIEGSMTMVPSAEIEYDGDENSMMRSMLDKMNGDDLPPGHDADHALVRQLDVDNDGDHDMDDHRAEKQEAYDNEPNPKTSGYDSMIPKGNDLSSKGGNEAGAVNGGGNPYTKTMEEVERNLFAEYRKFVGE